MGLLFGNFYYAYMAGRLAKKEGRTDVRAGVRRRSRARTRAREGHSAAP